MNLLEWLSKFWLNLCHFLLSFIELKSGWDWFVMMTIFKWRALFFLLEIRFKLKQLCFICWNYELKRLYLLEIRYELKRQVKFLRVLKNDNFLVFETVGIKTLKSLVFFCFDDSSLFYYFWIVSMTQPFSFFIYFWIVSMTQLFSVFFCYFWIGFFSSRSIQSCVDHFRSEIVGDDGVWFASSCQKQNLKKINKQTFNFS